MLDLNLQTEEQLRMVKPLTFGDLRKSIATVAVDMAQSMFCTLNNQPIDGCHTLTEVLLMRSKEDNYVYYLSDEVVCMRYNFISVLHLLKSVAFCLGG